MFRNNRRGSGTAPKRPATDAKGVSYFNHFPPNFLAPYGKASQAPDGETIDRRTNAMSCEWLTRPAVAVSEFAATMRENLVLLSEGGNQVTKTKTFKKVVEAEAVFLDSMQKLDKRAPGEPEKKDVNILLKGLYDEAKIRPSRASPTTWSSMRLPCIPRVYILKSRSTYWVIPRSMPIG